MSNAEHAPKYFPHGLPRTLAEAEAKAKADFELARFYHSLADKALSKAEYVMRLAETAYQKAQDRARDAKPAVCKTCEGSKKVKCPDETMHGSTPVCSSTTKCPPRFEGIDGGYCVVPCPDCSGD